MKIPWYAANRMIVAATVAEARGGYETGGFVVCEDGWVIVIEVANQSLDLKRYEAHPDDVREVLEAFGRYPDATWHSHVDSAALSERDRDSLRPWSRAGTTKHIVVTARADIQVHTLEDV